MTDSGGNTPTSSFPMPCVPEQLNMYNQVTPNGIRALRSAVPPRKLQANAVAASMCAPTSPTNSVRKMSLPKAVRKTTALSIS